jgi:hypothetical protein
MGAYEFFRFLHTVVRPRASGQTWYGALEGVASSLGP